MRVEKERVEGVRVERKFEQKGVRVEECEERRSVSRE